MITNTTIEKTECTFAIVPLTFDKVFSHPGKATYILNFTNNLNINSLIKVSIQISDIFEYETS